jgi:hypothetical protein
MKKLYLLILFLFSLNLVFAQQWTKISAVPTNDIIALAVNGNTIYAVSDSNEIYRSNDGGVAWSTIKVSNDPIDITSLVFYNNKIYVSTFNFGVFVSPDNGATWLKTATAPLWVIEFTVKNNILYACTLGNGVSVLNAATNSWSALNNSLPNYSVNVFGMTSSPDFLMIAAGANGTFYRYDFTTNNWQEGFYYGLLRPGLLIQKLINKADTVFAVNFNRIIRSNNAGTNWVDDNIGTRNGYNRTIYAGVNNHFILTNVIPQGTWIQQRNKHAVAGSTWAVNEEFFPTGYTYDIIEHDGALFLGKADGLYVKRTILAVDPPVLPVHTGLKIYPNPSIDGTINVESDQTIISLEIVNNVGQVVYKTAVNRSAFQIQTPLPAGMYHLQLRFNKGAKTTRMIFYK